LDTGKSLSEPIYQEKSRDVTTILCTHLTHA